MIMQCVMLRDTRPSVLCGAGLSRMDKYGTAWSGCVSQNRVTLGNSCLFQDTYLSLLQPDRGSEGVTQMDVGWGAGPKATVYDILTLMARVSTC